MDALSTESARDGRAAAVGVRSALDLTHHQLSQLTQSLRLDVGERVNYPRYERSAVHRLTAVALLRELRTPMEVAVRAVNDYANRVLAGQGWLVVTPADGTWTVGFVSTGPDLVLWLRAGGHASVLDLDRVSSRAAVHWAMAVESS